MYATTNAAPAASVTSGGGGGSGGFSGSISTIFIPSTPATTPTVTPTPPVSAPLPTPSVVLVTPPTPVVTAPVPAQLVPQVQNIPVPTVVPPMPAPSVRFMDKEAKLNVTVAQKLRFSYEYKNTSKATQNVIVTREWVNAKGKVVVRSTAKTQLKTNASWKKQVQETVPSKIVPGAYIMRIRITDKKGEVLGQNERSVEVKAKIKVPIKKKTFIKKK